MRCEHECCDRDGDDCYSASPAERDSEDAPDAHYCSEHAAQHGFCPVCGEFWGGIGTFELRGICDYCADELDEDDFDDLEDFEEFEEECGEYDYGDECEAPYGRVFQPTKPARPEER